MTQEPSVVRFKARLFRDPKAKRGSRTLLRIPGTIEKKFNGAGTVEGTINGHPFRAPLEAGEAGELCLRVNEAMRKGAGAGAGDSVQLAILEPLPEPALPPDLRTALKASGDASALWKKLTADARLIWIRWIEAAKKPETRARRVQRTVEQLAEGKRRPCCVNVYEFMLDRVRG